MALLLGMERGLDLSIIGLDLNGHLVMWHLLMPCGTNEVALLLGMERWLDPSSIGLDLNAHIWTHLQTSLSPTSS